MIDDLNEKRAALVAHKNTVTDAIVEINGKMISKLGRDEYTRLKIEKNKLIRTLQNLDTELTITNTKLYASLHDKTDAAVGEIPLSRQIIELRDYYQAFAADNTRSPTMRRMASELLLKLNPIVKAAISKKRAKP